MCLCFVCCIDLITISTEASWEEENWQAQYGQVIQPEDEVGTRFRYIDMWDWSIVRMTPKEGNAPVARIAGRLMQPSAKLHPSMPSHGGRLRTAPICKVHLDLVQVRSGLPPTSYYLEI